MATKTKDKGKVVYNATPDRKGNIIYIPFDADVTHIEQVNGISGLTFMPNKNKALPANGAIIRVKADGTNTPTLTGFTKAANSSDYDITANKINVFWFVFDGTDYWYSILIS